MVAPIDLTHQRFGKLFVIAKTDMKKNSQILWACHCDCGNFRLFKTNFLTKRGAKDCGCEYIEKCRKSKIKHGYKGSRVYNVVDGVIKRCYDTNKDTYHLYGGRGISVCDEWRCSRETFCKWLEDEGFRDGLQVDRIDNDKGYTPENCRLLPNSFNLINKRPSGLTGVCGVTLKKDNKTRPYLAHIRLYDKTYAIGYYSDLETAKECREFVASNLCEKVAEICKQNKSVPVSELKPRFIAVLDELLTIVRAVKGATV